MKALPEKVFLGRSEREGGGKAPVDDSEVASGS